LDKPSQKLFQVKAVEDQPEYEHVEVELTDEEDDSKDQAM